MAAQKGSGKKGRIHLSYSRLFPSSALILLGVVLIFLGAFDSLNLSNSINKSKEGAAQEVSDPVTKPAQLYIPKLAKVLEISDGEVIDNRWTVAESGVSYLTTSAMPGNIGNSVMYGHNKAKILGGLPYVVKGDPIYVVMTDGRSIRYEVFETKQIKPTQVEILNQSEDSRLTIYTCSGFLDTARFVVISKQIS